MDVEVQQGGIKDVVGFHDSVAVISCPLVLYGWP